MGDSTNSDDLGLVLGLGLRVTDAAAVDVVVSPTKKLPSTTDEPCLTLALSGAGETYNKKIDVNKVCVEVSSPHSSVSCFSNGRVKRERDLSTVSDEDEDASNSRKKLRLTKEQSGLLEESFKLHSTLNPKQKQALARQLNLRPRQVEVWFQNRRARTKLKQTEVDCEFLKKCCETLTDENRRLQKEVQELKALKLAQPLYMPMPIPPAATLTMCPSCQRLVGDGGASNNTPFPNNPHHLYNPYTHPSAAC